MTRKEEEQEAAGMIASNQDCNGMSCRQCKEFCAMLGIQWANAHPDKEKIIKYIKDLGYTITLNDNISREEELKDMERYVKYQKEKLIEKACEWLKDRTMKELCLACTDRELVDEFIETFREAMEE